MNRSFRALSLAALLLLPPALSAQVSSPHVGYVYPAGGQRGTTFEVKLGGQYFKDAADVQISGTGVLAKVVRQTRPLTQAELLAVALLLPVIHVEYALSEVEYFTSVVRSPDNADLAYDTYLIGHTRWFDSPEGSALLSHLRQRADLGRGAAAG